MVNPPSPQPLLIYTGWGQQLPHEPLLGRQQCWTHPGSPWDNQTHITVLNPLRAESSVTSSKKCVALKYITHQSGKKKPKQRIEVLAEEI